MQQPLLGVLTVLVPIFAGPDKTLTRCLFSDDNTPSKWLAIALGFETGTPQSDLLAILPTVFRWMVDGCVSLLRFLEKHIGWMHNRVHLFLRFPL